ncbi:hypothetical protein [Sinorhizobium terangae]|uniref:hypothetical protein n=1 Tax=Sinorhizobium terangae TaxID=110322 RepID=UPI0024B17AF9|nr:hypothetical protein [Sinorhizobium terangae]WFU50579.1 hypothetical protein QA637_27910 [Sinorhizobium terangae]
MREKMTADLGTRRGTKRRYSLSPETKGKTMIASPKEPVRQTAETPDEESAETGPSLSRPEDAKPVDQGRIPPVRSTDEANIDPEDVLPDDEEEQSIADNPSREEIRFGNVKPPRP